MTDLDTAPPRATAAALTVIATLGCAAACWLITIRLMRGMDDGTATAIGPFPSFAAAWMAMMAAMMLPGAVPAVHRAAQRDSAPAAILFAAWYLAVWALVGGAVYLLYRPHGTSAAAVLVLAAGLYELTPWKRTFRDRCRSDATSGFEFGMCCVGSSAGLMTILIAVGVMSVAWMTVIAVVVLAQKVFPPRAALDALLALAILGLGVLIAVAPTAVPGLMASMS